MIGLMAAEYLNNREKRSNEKIVRAMLDSAENAAERRFALRWADEHSVNVEELRDDEGRPYIRRYRRRGGRRLFRG